VEGLGSVVVSTGGSKSIGCAVALLLLSSPDRLVPVDITGVDDGSVTAIAMGIGCATTEWSSVD
jgi:hypothetical protein